MRIPGPSALFSAASSIRDEVTDLVLDLPATVGDVLDLISRAGETLDRVDRLLDRAEGLLGEGEDLLRRGSGLLGRGEDALTEAEGMLESGRTLLVRAEVAMTGAERTSDAAAAAVVDVQRTNEAAASTVDAVSRTASGADDLLRRGGAMLAPWEPISAKVVPVADRFVEHVSAEEVAALAGIVDTLPTLLTSLEDDVLPMLGTLDRVGPDVHEILETVHELTRALSGLPGAGLLKRRGEKKEEAESSGGPRL